MKDIIHYAHCIVATPGQKDQNPFYQYEAKSVEIEVTMWRNPDDDQDEWIVKHAGRIIANESWMNAALGSASYSLMAQSRIEAEKKHTWNNGI